MKRLLYFHLLLLSCYSCSADIESKGDMNLIVDAAEASQIMNASLSYDGSGYLAEVKAELASVNYSNSYQLKKKKLQFVLNKMNEVDALTSDIIKKTSQFKTELLESAGQDISSVKDLDGNVIIWQLYNNQNPTLPLKLNLNAIKQPIALKDAANYINSLKGDLSKFRKDIIEVCSNYTLGDSRFTFTLPEITIIEDQKSLEAQLSKIIEGSQANIVEDKYVLIDMFISLSSYRDYSIEDMSNVFEAICFINLFEQKILKARRLAMAHWKSKVSTGEYTFNKIAPMAIGPSVVGQGEDFEINVLLAAFDSNSQPIVTVEGDKGAVSYPGNGQGLIKLKAGSETMNLRGTISIINKSGIKKTVDWEHNVIVLKN